MLLLVSLCLIYLGSASSDSCLTPSLHNGYVVGEGDESTWTGALVCEPGYILVGSSKLKCRNGQWSANMPVCTAIGKCDPDNLPEIKNSRKDPYKTTQYRGAVYKFSCARGYKRLGNSLVHCNGDHWDLQRVPICSRGGCDESMMEEIAHGQSKRKVHGGVYFFKCREGGVLHGSSVVVCDGRKWNDTAPTCITPTRHPILSIEVDGAATKEVVAGSTATFVCDADEGNPEPTLTLFKNGEPLGPPTAGQNIHTFVPLQEDNTAVLSCNAINAAMPEHLSSETVLNVKFGPSEVHIGGANLMLGGEAGGYECVSSSSNPPAEIQWMVTDHQGNDVTHMLQVSESSTSWADEGWQTSSTAVLYPVSGVTVLHISCTASNSVVQQQVTDQKQVALKFAPENVILSGPSKVLSGSDFSLECVSAPSVPAAALTWSVTQAEERLKFSPYESVEQLEDGSFITRSSLSLVASQGHDLVVECYGTNDVMGHDFQAYAHVIEILSPPGVPKISGVSPNSLVQNLTCSTSAGNPPASLSWYRGQEMMDSHYQVEGDMVMAHITFVPSEHDEEVTCEASNEALSEPIRNTVVIEMNTSSDSTTFSYDYLYDEDDYANELVYEDNDLEQNVTDIKNRKLSADGKIDIVWTEYELSDDSANKRDDADNVMGNAVDSTFKEMEARLTPIDEHDKEAAATDDNAENTQNSKTDLGTTVNYSVNDIAEVDATADNHSETHSALKISLKDNTFENDSDLERKEDHSDTPTDAVFVAHQKQLYNTLSLKSSVKVTEATKTKEKDKQKDENETKTLKASQTMNSAKQIPFSFVSLCLTILIAKVTCC